MVSRINTAADFGELLREHTEFDIVHFLFVTMGTKSCAMNCDNAVKLSACTVAAHK